MEEHEAEQEPSEGEETVERKERKTYWTPPGCRAVRFTEVATMFLSDVE
jgi:hypothetical protein